MKIVRDLHLEKNDSLRKVLDQMLEGGGFTGKKLALAVEILEKMLKDEKCLRFLSFTGNLVATGVRGIFRDFVKKKFFDIIITTCGALDHDLARSFKNYYHGSFFADDKELHKEGIHRLGNIFIPKDSYGLIIEKKMQVYLKDIFSKGKRELSTYELCWELGERIKNKDSILFWAWKNKIPIVVLGITDGAVGYQIWQFSQDHKFKIDILKDEKFLSDLIWNAKRSGALVIGGGISKHHLIWWNLFKGGLDYAVYITTAQEYDGSLSGAQTREAISWGKIKEKAAHVTVEVDATIALPIIYAALIKG